MILHKTFQRRPARFRRDARGTSAVEFGLIAPLLLAALVGLADISSIAYGSSNMQAAVRAGIHYAMTGGTDAAVAQSLANGAWSRKPDDGVLTASRSCKCAGAAEDCSNQFCADNSRPEMYMTVTATGTLGGNFYSKNQTSTETVRVR